MEQLRMIYTGTEISAYPLPEGYSFEYYDGRPGQISDWVAICRQGLIGPDGSELNFRKSILDTPGIDPCRDLVFVVSPDGERVATITFYVDPDDGEGLLHMVCCLESARGHGIGNAMVSYAVRQLLPRGVRKIRLLTDDWRVPAIFAYLRFGFRPVTGLFDFDERWKAIFEKYPEAKKHCPGVADLL